MPPTSPSVKTCAVSGKAVRPIKDENASKAHVQLTVLFREQNSSCDASRTSRLTACRGSVNGTILLCLLFLTFAVPAVHVWVWPPVLPAPAGADCGLAGADRRRAIYSLPDTEPRRQVPLPACLVVMPVADEAGWRLATMALQSWVPAVEQTCVVKLVVSSRLRGTVGQWNGTRTDRVLVVSGANAFVALWPMALEMPQWQWLFKVEPHVFVNAAGLERVLRDLADLPSTMELQGTHPATGRRSSCLADSYVVGRDLLQQMSSKNFDDCLGSDADDEQFMKCAHHKCRSVPGPGLHLVVFDYDITTLGPSVDVSRLSPHDQQALQLAVPPPALESAFLAPIVTRAEFDALQIALSAGLAPVVPPPRQRTHGQYAQHYFQPSRCVHSPTLHEVMYGVEKCAPVLRECDTPSNASWTTKSLEAPAFVIALDTPEGRENWQRTRVLLMSSGFTDVRWFKGVHGAAQGLKWDGVTRTSSRPLTPGELGIRESYRRLLQYADQEGYPHIFVFEDDIRVDCEFAERVTQWWASPRCSDYMFSEDQGGIFLLGSTMWRSFGPIDAELSALEEARPEPMQCFNQIPGNYGAFAWMAHRATYRVILDWLSVSSDPFDWVWTDLALQGFIVRSAYPALVVADIEHSSSVKKYSLSLRSYLPFVDSYVEHRKKTHRWHMRSFSGDAGNATSECD